jgi:hypothetical protein
LQLDLTEEGTETVTVSLRSTSIEGAVLATSDPITVNDTSVPTYAISSNFSAVNEGSSLVFFVTTTGIANGTTLYWTANSSDIDPQSGSFEINSGSGAFAVVPSRDAITEGSETFTVSVRTDSVGGTIRATSGTITINDTSLDPTYAISPTSGSVSEGFSRTFTVTTTDVFDGTTLYWTVNTNAGDFETSSGSFVINSNTGTFSVSPTADRTSEGTETFTVSVRTDSIEGTAVVTTDSFNISDISLTPAFTTTPSSITEGNSGSFSVNNLGPAGTYYWTISNGTTTDARFSAVSGSFTTFIGNGSADFSVNPIVNTVVGDSATFQVQIREGSTSGEVLVTSSSVTVNDASIQIQMLTGPGGSVVTTVAEQAGRNVRFTCAANTPSYSYDWEVENITTTYNSQFFNSGDFSNGKGSVNLGPSTIDETAFLGVTGGDGIEGPETFRIIIKYFGQIYGRSEIFTISNDFQ